MGVVIGVIVGYALGSKAGPEGWAEIEDAWHTIVTSEEVQDLVAAIVDVAREVVEKRAEVVAGIIRAPDRPRLRPVAA